VIRTTSIFSHLAIPGLLTAAVFGASTAEAALVTLCGPNVCYEYSDDVAVNAGLASFGAPALLAASDSLVFTPTAFSASAADGGFQSVKAVFQFSRVYTLDGSEILDITVTESGDYRIIEGGIVSSSIRLQSVDRVNDGGGLFPQVAVTSPIPNFNTATPTGVTPENWSLTASISPADTFQDLASVVDLQIQNLLDAFTFAPGQSAFIQKKLVITTTTPVPVPAALLLLGSGLAGLGFVRRRKAA
jgi:hypothetical protein